jgi:hypothetical protein
MHGAALLKGFEHSVLDTACDNGTSMVDARPLCHRQHLCVILDQLPQPLADKQRCHACSRRN